MEIVLLILLCIAMAILCLWNIRLGVINYKSDKCVGKQIASILLLVILSFIAGRVSSDIDQERNPTTPTAMDVYRGNTSLEVTYRDSVPVDSSVVFIDFE